MIFLFNVQLRNKYDDDDDDVYMSFNSVHLAISNKPSLVEQFQVAPKLVEGGFGSPLHPLCTNVTKIGSRGTM